MSRCVIDAIAISSEVDSGFFKRIGDKTRLLAPPGLRFILRNKSSTTGTSASPRLRRTFGKAARVSEMCQRATSQTWFDTTEAAI
jgi:hypothetical protein